ncbi:MAG: hypothetical protein M3N26_00240 [Pseudomonadota bacterium]|nr:hypothetical protein [Pseudomonadota bacterium]
MSVDYRSEVPGSSSLRTQAEAVAREDDLRFLQAWEHGLVAPVAATVRVRQIRRALAALPLASLQVS